jgi:hypothetical protein
MASVIADSYPCAPCHALLPCGLRWPSATPTCAGATSGSPPTAVFSLLSQVRTHTWSHTELLLTCCPMSDIAPYMHLALLAPGPPPASPLPLLSLAVTVETPHVDSTKPRRVAGSLYAETFHVIVKRASKATLLESLARPFLPFTPVLWMVFLLALRCRITLRRARLVPSPGTVPPIACRPLPCRPPRSLRSAPSLSTITLCPHGGERLGALLSQLRGRHSRPREPSPCQLVGLLLWWRAGSCGAQGRMGLLRVVCSRCGGSNVGWFPHTVHVGVHSARDDHRLYSRSHYSTASSRDQPHLVLRPGHQRRVSLLRAGDTCARPQPSRPRMLVRRLSGIVSLCCAT